MKTNLKSSTKASLSILLGLVLIVGFQNCGKAVSFSGPGSNNGVTSTGGDPVTPPIVVPDPGSTVCGGLGNTGAGTDVQLGIHASLFTTPDTSNPLHSANDYVTLGNPVMSPDGSQPVNLFFNDINVPNRSFSQGFSNQNGDALTDASGNTLIEYFGLLFQSQFRLGADDPEGDYQFAVESDDGSMLQIQDDNGNLQPVVSNDGDHAYKTACASSVIHFNSNMVLPFKLAYYQGPRYYIALRVFWRRIDSSTTTNLAQGCDSGSLGNLDGTAASNYWKILDANNFQLPADQTNPCVN